MNNERKRANKRGRRWNKRKYEKKKVKSLKEDRE